MTLVISDRPFTTGHIHSFRTLLAAALPFHLPLDQDIDVLHACPAKAKPPCLTGQARQCEVWPAMTHRSAARAYRTPRTPDPHVPAPPTTTSSSSSSSSSSSTTTTGTEPCCAAPASSKQQLPPLALVRCLRRARPTREVARYRPVLYCLVLCCTVVSAVLYADVVYVLRNSCRSHVRLQPAIIIVPLAHGTLSRLESDMIGRAAAVSCCRSVCVIAQRLRPLLRDLLPLVSALQLQHRCGIFSPVSGPGCRGDSAPSLVRASAPTVRAPRGKSRAHHPFRAFLGRESQTRSIIFIRSSSTTITPSLTHPTTGRVSSATVHQPHARLDGPVRAPGGLRGCHHLRRMDAALLYCMRLRSNPSPIGMDADRPMIHRYAGRLAFCLPPSRHLASASQSQSQLSSAQATRQCPRPRPRLRPHLCPYLCPHLRPATRLVRIMSVASPLARPRRCASR
ncbi:hypothetical protein MRB53_038049 [Persea americana]|nr:hypothetical protein MRB53_038049 [Persea americana]